MILHIRRLLSAAMVLVVAGTLSMPVLAAPPLTESESLRLGLARPELSDFSRGRVGEAEANAQEAALWANPTLEYSRDRGRGSLGGEEESWRLAQPFDISGRRGLKREAGERRFAAAEAEARFFLKERAAEIRRGFYQLLRYERQLVAVTAWADRFSRVEHLVGKLRAAGEASGYDLRRLARERQVAEGRRAELLAELGRAREQFATLVGSDAWEGIVGRLLPAMPADLGSLRARLASRPDLIALDAHASADSLDERAAGRGWIPDVTLGIGSKRTQDRGIRDSATLVSISVPLPVFDRQQASERRAAARAMATRAEYRLAQAQAEGQLRGVHSQTVQLIAAAERYRSAALAPSGDLVHIAEAAYRAGESTILELLDAYKGTLETEVNALELEWKARAASIELDQLTGGYPE